MAERIENLDILFMKRNARKRGPTSSDQQNDMIEELAHDLAAIAQQWNSLLVPLTAALPDGTEGNSNNSLDAFANGLDGKNLFVAQEASSDGELASYYNTVAERPNSVYEQFQDVYQTITEAVDTLQNQIGFSSVTASQVSVSDTLNNFSSNNVEDALAELAADIDALASAPDFSLDLEAITTDVKPNLDDVRDLGSTTRRWADLHVSQRVFLSGTGSVSSPTLNFGDGDTGFWELSDDILVATASGVPIFFMLSEGGAEQLVLPLQDNAVRPSLAFGDQDTGFYEQLDDFLAVSFAGIKFYNWSFATLEGVNTNTWSLLNEASSSTNPVYAFVGDDDTGISRGGDDILSLIAGGREGASFTEVTSGVRSEFHGQAWSTIVPTWTPTASGQPINFDLGNSHVLDLESATGDVTLELNNPQAGASYVIKIMQDSTTPRNVVWPASVLWPDGLDPTISTGADAVDIVSLWYDGTNYFGNLGPNYS